MIGSLLARSPSPIPQRCLAVATGLLADRILGDPPNMAHPVAWFGKFMQWTEEKLWADRRLPGVAHTAIGVGLGSTGGALIRSTAAAVAITASGRQLRSTAARIGQAIEDGDVDRARTALPALVGRDPTELDSSAIAAAVIESVAENSVDAVVAPIFWSMVGGAAGAGAYRAINTMDAMIGHRSVRYRNFGWAAARLDDIANYIPARIFAAVVAAQNPRAAGRIYTIVRRDAAAHPSPNAGVAESAFAAALGCQLRYGENFENRPTLGDGPRPSPADVRAATELADRVELAFVLLLVTGWAISKVRRAG